MFSKVKGVNKVNLKKKCIMFYCYVLLPSVVFPWKQEAKDWAAAIVSGDVCCDC